MDNDDLAAKERAQDDYLPRDREREEDDYGCKERAVDDEQDECGDREDQCNSSRVESWVEARREGSRGRGSRETAEESCFLVVGGVHGAAVIGEKGGVRGGH